MATIEQENHHISYQNRCSGCAKGQVLDCSFANSKDAPSGLLVQTCLSQVYGLSIAGLQLLVDNPPGCYSSSYYQKGPRIGPNRKDQELDSWPSLRHPRDLQTGRAKHSQLDTFICSPTQPMLCLSRVHSYRPLISSVSSLLQMLHLLQNVKSSKALNAFVGKP